MTCPRCLAEVPADAAFCSGCGTPVDRAPTRLRSPEAPGTPRWEPPAAHAQGPPGPYPPSSAGQYAQGPAGQYAQDPRGQYTEAPRRPYPQGPRGQYTEAPRRPYPQGPPGPRTQDPRGQYAQDPAGQYAEAPPEPYTRGPAGQYAQDPRGQYTQAPRRPYPPGPPGPYTEDPRGQYAQAARGQYAQSPRGQYAQGPPGAAGRYPYGTPPPPPMPPVQFDLRRLTSADRAIGGASLVALITLFLPWFGFSQPGYSFSQSGIAAHGYLGIALLADLIVVGYLVMRACWEVLPVSLPVAHAPLLLVCTGLQLLIVLIAFLFKPSGLSWEIGAFLALLAAIAACAPIAVPALRWWQENHG